MKPNFRNEIKSYIVRSGYTMQEVVDRLSEDYGWSDSAAIPAKADQRTAHCCPDGAGNPLHGEKDDHRQYHSDPIRVQHTQGLCSQWDSCQGGKQPFGGKSTTSAKERRRLETAVRKDL